MGEMRFGLPVLALLASLAVPACSGGGGGGDDDDDGQYVEVGRVEISLLVPPTDVPAQDPFTGIATYHVEVQDSSGAAIAADDFQAGEDVEIQNLDAGTNRVVVLEGRNAGGVAVSRGRTLPFDIVESPTPVQRTLYFSRVGEFSTVYGTPAARTGAATWTFSDGSVLIAGGLVGGTAVDTAELFDFTTDAVVTAGIMSSGAQAFAPVATLGNDSILIVGGVSNAAGDPTDVANVFTLGAGFASGVPALPVVRREHGVAELGTGRAMVAGGAASNAATGAATDTTYLFEWDGAVGNWATGPAMDEPRMGPLMFAISGDVAVVAGGYNNNVSSGNEDFSEDGDVYSWDGNNLVKNAGNPQLEAPKGWSGVLETAANQWLVFGGEEDGGGGRNLLTLMELWTWTGTTFTEVPRDDLPTAQRGGAVGLLAGNLVLFLGGNTGLYPTDTPANTASIYDVSLDSFSSLPSSPGPTLGGNAAPLPDGTSLVVIDGAVLRYNPL